MSVKWVVDTSIICNQNDDIVIVIAVLINISIVDVCLLPLQICFVLLTIITNLIIVSIIAIICVLFMFVFFLFFVFVFSFFFGVFSLLMLNVL